MQKILYLILFFISPSAFAADNSGFLDSILEYIKGIFTAITDFVEWFGLLVVEVFKSAWLVLTDLFIWLFVSLFSLAADLLQNIGRLFNINSLTSQVSSLWSSIPAETSAILSAIGLPSAMAIIATGILIRFALQLIPFVRLGS